ncbi:MAG: stage II sporulation protein D [Ruminococcus sp.]|nr:stage II sporulation protein D [Ruminococcus sp.]
MKRYGLMMLGFGLLLTAVPTVPALIMRNSDAASGPEAASSAEESAAPSAEGDSPVQSDETIRMLDVSTGEVLTLSMRDYIIGAVCAEMPASFEDEALKAQAVAVHTYAVRQQQLEEQSPTEELCGAALSNDSSRYQAYFTKSQAMQFYGSGFESAYAKITAAAESVLPYILEYEDEPIIAAFCSMSPGVTESAENVWGQEVEYLVPVDSAGDENAPNFLEEVTYTAAELRSALETAFPEAELEGTVKEWLSIEETSESGTVLRASAGGVSVTGQEVRAALGLRSAAFEVTWEGDQCTVTTRGYGHGVGMSQYGANAMARSGADWQEILMHYYPGSEITSREEPGTDKIQQ